MPIILSIRGLRKTRREGAGYTLDMERFDALRGELVAVTGPSGCGKSTALDILAGILRPDAAERFIFAPDDNTAVDIMDAWRGGRLDLLALLRRRAMGYVLQTGGLLPFLSARDNIMLPLRTLGQPWNADIDALSERLGISRLLSAPPHKLSVGERQRVAVARALAASPPLILADEPTAALDPVNAESVLRLFTELARERQCTVILVTHAPETTRPLGFRECRICLAHPEPNEDALPASARAVLDAPATGVG